MGVAEQVKSVENDIRDAINWLSVLQEEYDLEDDAVKAVRDKLSKIARKVGDIKC